MARDRDHHQLAERLAVFASGPLGQLLLSSVVAGRYHERTLRWLAERANDTLEWQEAAEFGDEVVYVTAEELRDVLRGLDELLEPLRGRGERPELRPEGAREVTMIRLAFPTGS